MYAILIPAYDPDRRLLEPSRDFTRVIRVLLGNGSGLVRRRSATPPPRGIPGAEGSG